MTDYEREMVEKIRKEYPIGMRIELISKVNDSCTFYNGRRQGMCSSEVCND